MGYGYGYGCVYEKEGVRHVTLSLKQKKTILMENRIWDGKWTQYFLPKNFMWFITLLRYTVEYSKLFLYFLLYDGYKGVLDFI